MKYSEKEIIGLCLEGLYKSQHHVTPFFHVDAEPIDLNGTKLLVNVDEFSEEDHFRDIQPYSLGWNVAVGTISDILASGGMPIIYLHSLGINKKWDKNYLKSFIKGISDLLGKYDTGFGGGDLAESEKWHYTGICIGKQFTELSRMGCKPGDIIYFTGYVGSGNLEACLKMYGNNHMIAPLMNHYPIRFRPRKNEAEIIHRYASACIDTSDGLLNGLMEISNLNQTGFEVEKLPYIRQALPVFKVLGKPVELLMICECGEYELLFTIPAEKDELFRKAVAQNSESIHKIGIVREPDKKCLVTKTHRIDFSEFKFSARSFANISEYLEQISLYLREHAFNCG